MPFAAGDEQVAEAHVRERPAHHHLVVPAPGAVRVEVLALDAVLDEVAPRRAVRLDRAGGRDVVGGDAVADHDQAAGAGDVLDRAGLRRHALEVRRQAHVRRVGIPREEIALGNGQRRPVLVAGEDVGVRAAVHVLVDRLGDRVLDLLRRRPEVAQEDLVPVLVAAERLGGQVEVDAARRARRRRRAAARRGSSPSPPDGCAPRSCGCRRGRRRRRARRRRPPRRSRAGAAPSCRCRSCSRSRRCESRAPRGTASGPPCRSTRSRPWSRARGSTSPTACGRGRARPRSSPGARRRP